MSWIYKILYNLVTRIASLKYVRRYKLLAKNDRSYLEFLGHYPDRKSTQKSIWIHCASVGEVKISAALIRAIHSIDSERKIILTVKTVTGRETAQVLAGDLAEIRYCPYDLKKYVKRAFDYINPEMLILIETELWPNLLAVAVGRNIDLYLINGRISDSSIKNYHRLRKYLGKFLQHFKSFLMQSELDCQRIVKLGADQSKISLVHNLKYDVMRWELEQIDPARFRQSLELNSNDGFIIAGSTRADEEQYPLEAFIGMKDDFPNLRLIIAPRHTERIPEIETHVKSKGLTLCRRSDLTPEKLPKAKVILLDTMGELTSFYSISKAAFVGGSLVPKGGQNPLEPVGLGIPTCYGPSMENFSQISESLQELKLAVQIKNTDELRDFFRAVLSNQINPPDPGKIFDKYAGGAEIAAKKIME